jgi:hypothetical protein
MRKMVCGVSGLPSLEGVVTFFILRSKSPEWIRIECRSVVRVMTILVFVDEPKSMEVDNVRNSEFGSCDDNEEEDEVADDESNWNVMVSNP